MPSWPHRPVRCPRARCRGDGQSARLRLRAPGRRAASRREKPARCRLSRHGGFRQDASAHLRCDRSRLAPSGDVSVTFHGGIPADSPVRSAVAAMRDPSRVVLAGHAADPRAVLEMSGIFLYLLDPHHYGTAENALVEAMSLGVVPIVLANPCEQAIVTHGVTASSSRYRGCRPPSGLGAGSSPRPRPDRAGRHAGDGDDASAAAFR